MEYVVIEQGVIQDQSEHIVVFNFDNMAGQDLLDLENLLDLAKDMELGGVVSSIQGIIERKVMA